jgi:hypothetical protein
MSSSDKSKLDGMFEKDYELSLTQDTVYQLGATYISKYPKNTILYCSITYDITENGSQYGCDGIFVIAAYAQNSTYNFNVLGSYNGFTMLSSNYFTIKPKYYNTVMKIYKVFSPS